MTFNEEHAIETFKSLITVSMEGLKTLLLINGGAVVVLLAFLGQSSLGPRLAPHFWYPIGLFVAGVTFCAFAFVGSYSTQFSLFNEYFPNREYRCPKHMTCLKFTVVCIIISVICFVAGAFYSISVLASYGSPELVKSSPSSSQAASSPVSAGSALTLPTSQSAPSHLSPNPSSKRTTADKSVSATH